MESLDVLGTVVSLLIVFSLAFWVWMLVDCLKHPAIQGKQKMAWVLAMVLFNVFGALAYFVVAHPVPTNEA